MRACPCAPLSDHVSDAPSRVGDVALDPDLEASRQAIDAEVTRQYNLDPEGTRARYPDLFEDAHVMDEWWHPGRSATGGAAPAGFAWVDTGRKPSAWGRIVGTDAGFSGVTSLPFVLARSAQAKVIEAGKQRNTDDAQLKANDLLEAFGKAIRKLGETAGQGAKGLGKGLFGDIPDWAIWGVAAVLVLSLVKR